MNAADFARLAQEAYYAKPDIGTADSASRAIIRDTPVGRVVAFPGTDNLACVIADFDATEYDVAGLGQIHRGFWRAWFEIEPQVLEATFDQPVTFVGHSLGAAMALLAAGMFLGVDRPVVAVWGFGAPRPSPMPTVATVLSKTPVTLFRNGHDLVTEVPPDWAPGAKVIPVGKPFMDIPNVIDHKIARYIEALNGQATAA